MAYLLQENDNHGPKLKLKKRTVMIIKLSTSKFSLYKIAICGAHNLNENVEFKYKFCSKKVLPFETI